MATKANLDPLREFLDLVVTRIETLEAHCGLGGGGPSAAASSETAALQKTLSAKHVSGSGA